MSRALKRMRSNIWVLSRFRRMLHTPAVAAATIGAEKLVPLERSNPLGLKAYGTATTMFSPGAARSTAYFRSEKYDGSFAWSVAATVSTWLKLAGYSMGFPWTNSFPAAATGIDPVPNATSNSSSRSGSYEFDPQLMLITDGPRRIAASIPAMNSASVNERPSHSQTFASG